MSKSLFFFYCCICLSLVFAVEADQTATNDEQSILLSLKSDLVDPMDCLKDWKMPSKIVENGSVHCNWTGVWCNSKGFVEKLDISNMNLSGSVSDKIQGLRSLSSLNISCNGFESSLPKSLFLSSLKMIDVSQNNFFGKFPTGL